MIKNILVPTDFSKCSINALRYASQLAEKLNVQHIYVMHALSEPITYGDVGITSTALDLATEQEIEIDQSFIELKKSVPQLRKTPHSLLKKSGFVVDTVIEISRTDNIDLVIMGTNGATGIDEVIMGTNTYAVIKESKIPVLVVPDKAEYKRIDNIVLASDYKSIEGETLETLRNIDWVFGSKVHVIHISDKKQLESEEAEQAKKYEYYLKNVPHEYHFVLDKDVEKGIENYVKDHNIDLITLIPRKHKFFDMVFGSGESKKIIFHTKTPLLALPG